MTTVEQAIADMQTQLDVLSRFMDTTKLPGAPGLGERSVAKAIMDMEIYVNALVNDPPVQKSTIDAIIDAKLATALAMSSKSIQDDRPKWAKSVLESKAMQDIGHVIDAKQ